MTINNIELISPQSKRIKDEANRFNFCLTWLFGSSEDMVVNSYVEPLMLEQTLAEIAILRLMFENSQTYEVIDIVNISKEEFRDFKAFQWLDSENTFLSIQPTFLAKIEITYIDENYQEYATNFIDKSQAGSTIDKYQTYFYKKNPLLFENVPLNYSKIIGPMLEEARASREKAQLEINISSLLDSTAKEQLKI